jgi:hypothetical protein
MTQKNIQEIIDFAQHAHQERALKPNKGTIPYHWHLIRVMLRLGKNATYREKAVAIFHDILEDTTVTVDELRDFIQDEDIVQDVITCSNNQLEGATNKIWMNNIAFHGSPTSIRVKYSDISDNLGFERLIELRNYLIANKPQITKNNIRNNNLNATYPLLNRIEKAVKSERKGNGGPRSFSTYYNNLNSLFENKANLEICKGIHCLDFTDRIHIRTLLSYLSNTDKHNYMEYQNLNSWTVCGEIDWIKSSTGHTYLALKVPNEYLLESNKYLQDLGLEAAISNKMLRDDNSYHITILPSNDMNKLEKEDPQFKEKISPFIGKKINLFFYGIGTGQKTVKEQTNITYFGVVEHPLPQKIRALLNLPPIDLHITLAFDKKDVFGLPKDRSTLIIKADELHKTYYPSNKLNQSLGI